MSREEGERTGSLRSNRDREWLILGENGSWERVQMMSEGILSMNSMHGCQPDNS